MDDFLWFFLLASLPFVASIAAAWYSANRLKDKSLLSKMAFSLGVGGLAVSIPYFAVEYATYIKYRDHIQGEGEGRFILLLMEFILQVPFFIIVNAVLIAVLLYRQKKICWSLVVPYALAAAAYGVLMYHLFTLPTPSGTIR